MNSKQMLSDFQANFTEFRESFHNVMNNVMAYEMSSDLGTRREQSTKRLEELDKLIEEKKNEINSSTLTGEELEILKQRNEALINGYNQEKDVISKDQKDIDKDYEADVRAYREELKNSITKLRDSFGVQTISGKEISKIDLLRENIKNQITSYDYQLVTLKSELDKSKDPEEIKRIANEMRKIRDKKIQRENFLDKLSDFEKSFASLESKYVKGNKFVDVFDLEKYSFVFEELANAIEGSIENTLISFNVITNADGTYSLDMRCGNKIGEPRPIIAADKLDKETVNKYLKGFAGVVASKTDLSIDDLMNGQVIVKKDGVTLGREDFKNVGSVVETKIANNISNNGPENNGPENNGPENNGPENNGPENNGPENNGPENNGPENNGPENNGPENNGPENNGPENNGPENNGPENNGPENTTMLDNCIKIRMARKAGFNKVRKAAAVVGTIAGIGLGICSGLTPALTVAAATTAFIGGTSGIEILGDCMDQMRQFSVKRKMKKIAKEFDLKLEYGEDGTLKFYKEEGPDKVYVTKDDQRLAAEIQSELDRSFKYINGPRPKQGFENNPRVDVENLEAAFVEFGGLGQTKKERSTWNIANSTNGWTRIVDAITRRNERALEDERSVAEEVSLDEVEGLEEVADVNEQDQNVIEAQVVNGRAVEVDDMVNAMEGAEQEEVISQEQVTGTGQTSEGVEQEEIVSQEQAGTSGNSNEDLDEIELFEFEDLLGQLDDSALNIEEETGLSNDEIQIALATNTLDKQTAIEYLTNCELIDNDLVEGMKNAGILSQDEIDMIMIAKSEQQELEAPQSGMRF